MGRSDGLHLARLCGVILLTLICQSSLAADLRIVVDVSKSMHTADPHNLRGAGIELLARNLADDQSGGIWAYSQLTQKLVEYGPASGLWKQLATIHGRNLEGQSRKANLPGALEAATWDLDRPDRAETHLVLFSNGLIDTGLTPLEHSNLRQLLLNSWAAKLRNARVRVHTIALNQSDAASDMDLLRQLADLSGGLHKSVADLQALQNVLMDIVELMQAAPQAAPDANGRFQIAPGAAAMNVLWLARHDQAGSVESPVLVQPDGSRLDRLSPLVNGRWVLARDFEMVNLREPQVGWWRIEGVAPQRLSILGELEIRVDGVATPVVPTEESHALIRLFSDGQLIEDEEFLNLLSIRAWLQDDRQRLPLPVDRVEDGFQAYFVNLGDGAYELEVEVAAPTFKRFTKVPFVAANPLRVDFKNTADGDLVAWLQFNHAAVDYSTVRAGAKVRKPPQVGVIVPAQRMPAGLFQIPIREREGVVEMSFSVSGNYLNKKGFFLKTRAQTITLPMLEEVSFRFAADGKLLNLPGDVTAQQASLNNPGALLPTVADSVTSAPMGATQVPPTADIPADEALPLIPLWFVALVTVLNALLGGMLWWFNKPKAIQFELLQPPALELPDAEAESAAA